MENMENKEQTPQTKQQNSTTTSQKVDTSMDPVVIFGGIAMMVIGRNLGGVTLRLFATRF